jgi:hypothetical protein
MRLKAEGWYVIAADWKVNEFMQPAEFCHVFAHCDLRQRDNCVAVSEGCEQCYNMAADMGGMGFIVSNQSGIRLFPINKTAVHLHNTSSTSSSSECETC